MTYAVVLPVFNEKEHLCLMVSKLKQAGHTNIIVVDGFSTDGSLELAKKINGVHVLCRNKPGKGSAISKALEFCFLNNIETVVLIDCDNTYPVDPIAEMVSLSLTSDLVIAERDIWDVRSNYRRLGNKVVKWLLWLRYGVKVPDPLSGLKALRVRSFYQKIVQDDFLVEPEICIVAIKNHYSTNSVGIDFNARPDSKLSAPESLVGFGKLLRLLILG